MHDCADDHADREQDDAPQAALGTRPVECEDDEQQGDEIGRPSPENSSRI